MKTPTITSMTTPPNPPPAIYTAGDTPSLSSGGDVPVGVVTDDDVIIIIDVVLIMAIGEELDEGVIEREFDNTVVDPMNIYM